MAAFPEQSGTADEPSTSPVTSNPAPETPPSSDSPKPVNAPATPAAPVAPATKDDRTSAAAMDAMMEASIAGANAPDSSAASAAPAQIRGPRVVQAGREHRSGKIVSIGPEDVFVEFGPKELGVAKRTQWQEGELPAVGEELALVVDRYDANEQLFICVKPGAVQKADWELLEVGQVVEARVTGVNKGGLSLEIANHRAFMPASLVDVHRIEDLSVFVGERLQCQVQKIDRRGRGDIVLSRRDLLKEERKEAKAKLKETLAAGQELEGVVRKIMDFGAFVDLGGVDGLVHVSDMTHERGKKVEDVVQEGDKIKVQVLKVDWDKNRISLGMKQLQPDPWSSAMEAVTAGEEASGRVTKIAEFGAFVEIAPGIEGLVHISEMSWKRVADAAQVVKPNEVVTVKVLEVDEKKRRISLSIKQLTEQPASMRKKDKGGEQARSIEEIQKETPQLRRLREQSKKKEKDSGGLKSGLGNVGSIGLGDLGELNLG